MPTPLSHRLIAHRGWQRRFPENSLAGIAAAIEAGAKHVEIDIQLTADRQAVLCHDGELQRLCGVAADINDLELAALKPLSMYEPQRLGERFRDTPLATLGECVELLQPHQDVTLYVELKRHSIRRFGAAAVLRTALAPLHGLAGRCRLISFDLTVLEQARAAGWPDVAPILCSLEQLQEKRLVKLMPQLLFCDLELLAPTLSLSQLPYPLALYEVDTPMEARQWFARGAALVETFAIGELIQALQADGDG